MEHSVEICKDGRKRTGSDVGKDAIGKMWAKGCARGAAQDEGGGGGGEEGQSAIVLRKTFLGHFHRALWWSHFCGQFIHSEISTS